MKTKTSAPVYRALYIGAILAFIASSPATPQGQVPDTVSLPAVVPLQHGQPFQGDLRQFPSSLPSQREHRPEHGEAPMLRPVSFGDQAVQVGGALAPAPPPGTGGGAGNFAGLNYAQNGDGWPPDTNGDVGP